LTLVTFLFSFLSFYPLDTVIKIPGNRTVWLPSPSPPFRRHMVWFLIKRSLSKKPAEQKSFYVAAFGCIVQYRCGNKNTGCWLLFARSKCAGSVFQIELLTHQRAGRWERVLTIRLLMSYIQGVSKRALQLWKRIEIYTEDIHKVWNCQNVAKHTEFYLG
jgi:hypothetical protein